MVERNQNIIRFRCTQCGSPLKAMVTRVGHALSCPQCGAEVEVPRQGEDAGTSNAAPRTATPATKPVPRAAPEVPTEPAPGPPDDEYAIRGMDYSAREPAAVEHSGMVVPVADLPDDYEAPGRRPDREWEEDEVKPPDERPKLPPRPMVDGVFRCFGQMPVLLCWAVLSLFVSALVGVAYYAILLGSIQSVGTWVGSLVLTGGLTLVAMLTLIVTNAYLMAILHDSAAGNDLIVNWPDTLFLTWATDAFFLITAIAVPFILAWTLMYPLGGLLAGGWVILIPIYWLLFPIVLLSTLEMQSPLVPVSPVVIQSLRYCGRTWGVFYLQTALIGVVVLSMAFGFHVVGFMNLVGVAILGGAATFASMLYFRLLGRVAWVCDERFRELRAQEEEEEDENELDETGPEIRPTPVDDF